MEGERFLFLKMHDCAEGLEDDIVRDIAEHAELVRCESGDVIHRVDDVMSSVYLIVQGRTRHAAFDVHGRVFLERTYSRGEQFGGLGAALAEPVPVQITSLGPSVLLKFDYEELLKLTLKHRQFRTNMSRLIARARNS